MGKIHWFHYPSRVPLKQAEKIPWMLAIHLLQHNQPGTLSSPTHLTPWRFNAIHQWSETCFIDLECSIPLVEPWTISSEKHCQFNRLRELGNCRHGLQLAGSTHPSTVTKTGGSTSTNARGCLNSCQVPFAPHITRIIYPIDINRLE